eukprot:6397230-Prymnesium_polylepis.1
MARHNAAWIQRSMARHGTAWRAVCPAAAPRSFGGRGAWAAPARAAHHVDTVGGHGEARLVHLDLRGLAAGRARRVQREHHNLERRREQQQPRRRRVRRKDARARPHERC